MNQAILDRAYDLAHAFESKSIRRVRTQSGVRRFNQPIGSIIVADRRLVNITLTDKVVYDGWDVVKDKQGNEYSVGYDDDSGKWIATEGTESWDAVVEADSEEEVFDALDSRVGGGRGKTSASGSAPRTDKDLTPKQHVDLIWLNGGNSRKRYYAARSKGASHEEAMREGEKVDARFRVEKIRRLTPAQRREVEKLNFNQRERYAAALADPNMRTTHVQALKFAREESPAPKRGTFHHGPNSATSSNDKPKKPTSPPRNGPKTVARTRPQHDVGPTKRFTSAKQRAEYIKLPKDQKEEYDRLRNEEDYTHDGAMVQVERRRRRATRGTFNHGPRSATSSNGGGRGKQ